MRAVRGGHRAGAAQNRVDDGDDGDVETGLLAFAATPDLQATIANACADARRPTAQGEPRRSATAPVFAAPRTAEATPASDASDDPHLHVAGVGEPVSEFDTNYFVMAFPEIFLTGNADLSQSSCSTYLWKGVYRLL